jgi:phosphonate transport system substrate-binding protein
MLLSNRISTLDRTRRGHLRLAVRFLALAALAAPASAAFALGHAAQAADTLHFAVGPLQPTPGETKKAFDPFF